MIILITYKCVIFYIDLQNKCQISTLLAAKKQKKTKKTF